MRSVFPSPNVMIGTGSDWLLDVSLSSVMSEMLAQLLFGGCPALCGFTVTAVRS